MGTISVKKTVTISAAHHLPDYEGACRRVHGHNYRITLTVSRIDGLMGGMVMDFAMMKKVMEEVVVKKYDHRLLNDYWVNPTAEVMAAAIAQDVQRALESGLKVVRVEVEETEGSCAVWESEI